MRKLFLTFSACILTLLFLPVSTHADEEYSQCVQRYGDHYSAVIIDDFCGQEEFFSDSEEEELFKIMMDITEFTNIMLVGTYDHPSDTQSYGAYLLKEYFGSEPAVCFLIDMDDRQIFLVSTGSAQRTITDNVGEQITDKVYLYATESYDRDFGRCALEAMELVYIIFDGGRISSPMKIICNLFLAFIIALFINFFYIYFTSRSKKPSSSDLLSGVFNEVNITNVNSNYSHQTKRYSPQSSGSSSSGRSSGGGSSSGGSSGGGHSI